jgi:hypothetical protein
VHFCWILRPIWIIASGCCCVVAPRCAKYIEIAEWYWRITCYMYPHRHL